MSFGLTNAPATFQLSLDVILTCFNWESYLVYMDDIIIYSNSVEEHLRYVDEILTALPAAGVMFKLKKCIFFGD